MCRRLQSVSVAIAEGRHPVPYRTRKLSPPAPMVLPGKLGGRVGRRRSIFTTAAPTRGGFGVSRPVVGDTLAFQAILSRVTPRRGSAAPGSDDRRAAHDASSSLAHSQCFEGIQG